jgi:hypothetical protein
VPLTISLDERINSACKFVDILNNLGMYKIILLLGKKRPKILTIQT